MKIDQYELETCIGKGAFGEGYLTSVKGDSKKYFTKKIFREEIEGSKGMNYLRNEIMILRYFDHPNIIKIKEVKKTKKHYYIIMEYCNGGKLSSALKTYINKYGKPFPEELVQHFMRQIIDVFKYIHHEKKIIHEDLNIDNILLNFDNEEDLKNFDLMKSNIKLTDFGFAETKKGIELEKLIGLDIKSPPPPQIFRKQKYEKDDIWSIGTICYEMITGKQIFNVEDKNKLVEKIEYGSYEVPTSLSHESVSFLNAMLQYVEKRRLSAEQLSKHDFIVKDVKNFKKINLEKISDKVKGDKLIINYMNNDSIWSIFNSDNQISLMNNNGNQIHNQNDKKVNEMPKDESEKIKKESDNQGYYFVACGIFEN